MRSGGPMGCTCVKPDDYERLYENAKKAGQQDLVVRIHPDGQYRLNLMETMLKGHGSPLTAAQHLAKVGEVGQPHGSGVRHAVVSGNAEDPGTQRRSLYLQGSGGSGHHPRCPRGYHRRAGNPAGTPGRPVGPGPRSPRRRHAHPSEPVGAELIRKGCRQGLFTSSTSSAMPSCMCCRRCAPGVTACVVASWPVR